MGGFLSYYLLLQIIKLTSHLSAGIWVRLYGYLFPWGNPEGNGTEEKGKIKATWEGEGAPHPRWLRIKRLSQAGHGVC